MERRGSDKITRLHAGLILGSFALLAINIVLSWLVNVFVIWYPALEGRQIEVSWLLYALVMGMLLSANLYKVPTFLKWFDRGNGDSR